MSGEALTCRKRFESLDVLRGFDDFLLDLLDCGEKKVYNLRVSPFWEKSDGGDPVSTGHVETRLRAEDVGWPR